MQVTLSESNELKRKRVEPKTYHSTFTVFPDALNYAGTLFGGKLLSEMDLAASNTARKLLYDTDCNGLVTAHISSVDFLNPAHLGDIVQFETKVKSPGRTSIHVDVHVKTEDTKGRQQAICEAQFVFVALKEGKPHPHLKSF